ncbi:MAG: GTPase HflX, partial [Moraxella sp.]|nr:GTPase HflX [Moraxella sp.]
VGFVQNLPHELVESFHATLEETLEADLLLHIIDSSSENRLEQIEAVNTVLSEIKADAPILCVYNKIDKTNETPAIYYDNGVPSRVYLSAITGDGVDKLSQAVTELLGGEMSSFHLTIGHHQGALAHALYKLSAVETAHFDEMGRQVLSVRLPTERLRQLLGQFHLTPADVLPKDEADKLAPPLEAFEQPTTHSEYKPFNPADDLGR